MLVGGINGAGKSTFSQNVPTLRKLVELSEVDEVEVINPDTVTRELRAEQASLSEQEANRLAADQCEKRVRSLVEARRGHFVIETVLSSDKYKSIVQRAIELGWSVLFVYVALQNVDEAIRRVAARVRAGGHDVPTEKIRARWPRSLENLPWFWERSHACFLMLNRARFEQPCLLAAKQGDWTRVQSTNRCPHVLGPVLRATASGCGVRLPGQ